MKNWRPLPRLLCADGFSISIQANGLVYCSPRSWRGPYTHVECGFPSEDEPLLEEWAEDPSSLTGTVYGYVPIEVVASVLKKHGGIVGFIDRETGEEVLSDNLEETVKIFTG